MNVRRNASGFVLVGFLTVWMATSDAFAAAASVSDVTDFITRVGGYFFEVDGGPSSNNYHYWFQVSYTVNASGGAQNPSGGGQNPSGNGQTPSSGGTNITKIVMTKSPMAAIALPTAAPAPPPPTLATTSPNLTQLNPCEAENYTVETVTLDLRDLKLSTTSLKANDGKPILGKALVDNDGNPRLQWQVFLRTNSNTKFIRKNTQTFPANCAAAGGPSEKLDAKVEQTDVSQYPILFADLDQANRFLDLLNNMIPTLNPLTLIPLPK